MQTKEQNAADLGALYGWIQSVSYCCITLPQKCLQRIALHQADMFLCELIQVLISFWGAGRVFLTPPTIPSVELITTISRRPNGLTAYFVSFYVLHLVLMPFLQQHLHETPRYLHFIWYNVAHFKVKIYHTVGSLSTFNSACSLLFVTAHITEEQVVAITYYLKRNLVKFHLGHLGFSGRAFSGVGGFFSKYFSEIVNSAPFVPCLYKLPMLY